MAELVRVRTKSGAEINVSAVVAKRSDDLTILDEPAQVAHGKTRPASRKGGRRAKPKTTVAEAAAAKKPVTESGSTKGSDQ